MGLVSGTVKNLFGGVSQAPAEQRDASELSEQLNALPIYGQKLGRRPPLLHVAKMTSAVLTGAFEHQLGDFTVFILGDVVRVFETATGIEQTVVNNVSWGYLSAAVGRLKAVTLGDTVVVLNTGVTVLKDAATTDVPEPSALVTVLAGDYETEFVVTLDGTDYTYTTLDATFGRSAIDTTLIATHLATALVAAASFVVEVYGSTLYIKKLDGSDFSAGTKDGLGNMGLSVAKDAVDSSEDLPSDGVGGTVVRVAGGPETLVDDYYVTPYIISDFFLGAWPANLAWIECPAPGSQYKFDTHTLPVQITRAGSVFTVDQAAWAERAAGDDITNPFPSFTNKTLDDLFIYQGRLGFLSSDGVMMSRAGKLFDFFRSSAAQILSDDPVDISGSISGLTALHWAIPWNEGLYLFANGRAQYRLSGSGDLTASSVRLEQVSEYRYDETVRPVVSGRRMFFVALKSGLPHVMDYHTKGYQKVHEAVDVGTHIPTYLKGTAKDLTADDAQGILLLRTNVALYVYNYRFIGDDEKVQGAWGTWTFSAGTILSLSITDGFINLVQAYSDGTYLNRMILDPARVPVYTSVLTFDGTDTYDATDAYGAQSATEHSGAAVHLDRYLHNVFSGLSYVYDGVNTTWTLPYSVAVDGSEGVIAVAGDNASTLLVVTRPTATTVRVPGDWRYNVAHIGILFETANTLSTIFVRDRQSGQAETRGRLQLRWLRLKYVDVLNLTVTVTLAGRSSRVYTAAFTYAQSGEFLIPVGSRNEDCTIVVRASAAGAEALVGYSWEGTYHTRAARI